MSAVPNDAFVPTPRARVRRLPDRGHYDRVLIHHIIDEALLCHVGFVIDDQPFVIPTIHVRVADQLYIHGSPASRMLRHLKQGGRACVSITLLDGLVLARSAFHHSMNYRSVVILASGTSVEDNAEKRRVLDALVEHVIPGRSADARGPNEREMRATALIRLPIEEASAKVRSGPPGDEEQDYDLPVWAGVIPMSLRPGEPQCDPRMSAGIGIPAYASNYRRPGLDAE